MADANPGLLSAAAKTMADRLSIMRAAYGGTETMRAQQETFLPKYEKETDARWQTRLNSTFALNKVREAVDAASAKPFRTILQLVNSDPDLDLMIQDIDLQGNHLHIFAHQFFNNGLLDGMCHILVDHPDTVDLPNLAAQKAANIRPYFKLIKAGDVVAAYDEYVGGDTQCVHVRLKSSRIERMPDFSEKVWNQIYLIEKDVKSQNGVVQIYEQDASSSGGQWALVANKTIPMIEVPFVTFYAGDKESDYVTRPIFIDLAYKQIEHWQSSSDQRSILSAARFPMLASSGVELDPNDPNGFAIGPYKILYSPEANGRWYYVEPKGTAIESGAKDLEALEMHMDMMALNPVTGTHRQYVPQNERNIQETRVHSVVHDLTIAAQDSIEKAIRFMGNWTNKDYSQVQVIMNKDFAFVDEKMKEMDHLVKIWAGGGLSTPTLLQEAKNRDLLAENFSPADEMKLIAQLAASAAASAATTGTPAASAGPTGTSPTPAAPASGATKAQDVPGWPAGQNRPTAQV